jgi:hypothetical protein
VGLPPVRLHGGETSVAVDLSALAELKTRVIDALTRGHAFDASGSMHPLPH